MISMKINDKCSNIVLGSSYKMLLNGDSECRNVDKGRRRKLW